MSFLLAVAVLVIPALVGTSALANEELLELQDDPGQWVMTGKNYAGWNYSALDQINTENVDQLQVAWTFQTGVLDSHEAEPLVVDDTMYVITPKPNTVYALDLTNNGIIKWSFRPDNLNVETATQRACCGAQTRGFAYAEDKIFFNTLGGEVFALDAETGEVVWSEQNADLSVGETMSTAPIIIGDQVIVGVAGGEYGIRGHITAYGIDDGERRWRFHSMGPNEDVGIGENFDPVYEGDQVDSPGLDTWYGDSWERGGGSIWGWFTYDPDLGLFYYGTGNCAPWNPDYRRDPATAPGLDTYENKYCASVLARDADTGELAWAYSITPQDQWDYDEPAVFMSLDLELDGENRQALVHQARNGFFYAWDRATGELLVEPWEWGNVNWAEGIDMETGRPIYNEEKLMFTGQPVENVCPISAGNWEQQSFSPETGLFYMNSHNSCFSSYTVVKGDYEPGQTYTLTEFGGFDRGEPRGIMMAVDPLTGERAWTVESENVRNARPILTTGGNLLMKGTELGAFVIRDASNGEQLWSFRTGSGFRNSPITYTGPDGKQYIAIIASSGPTPQQVSADEPADAAGRFARAGSTLYVFTLPDSAAQAEAAGE